MSNRQVTQCKCKQCGEAFYDRTDFVLNGRGGRYCSRPCSNRHRRQTSLLRRFWKYVNKTDGCWLWTGAACGENGYGNLYFAAPEYRYCRAHRISWEIHFGPIPDGLLVCHHCDVRLCVRPDHLFLGTQRDNMMDMIQKGRARLWGHNPPR